MHIVKAHIKGKNLARCLQARKRRQYSSSTVENSESFTFLTKHEHSHLKPP